MVGYAKSVARYPDHNVLAVFPDADAARDAMVTLERGGIEAKDISLLARKDGDDGEGTVREGDRELTADVGKRVATGAAVGGAGGGLAGLIAGAAAFAIPGIGPVVGAGIWGATLGGAVAGTAVGGVVGGISGLGMGEAWEATYSEVENGRVVVGVHAEDSAVVDRGARLLKESGGEVVGRFDAEGRRTE